MFHFVKQLKQVRDLRNISRQEAAQLMAEIKLPYFLELISAQMPWIIVSSMWLGSTFLTILFLQGVSSGFGTNFTSLAPIFKTLLLSVSPFIFLLTFVLLGGVFSFMGRAGIISGKFPRLASHPIYALRRIYGTAWTQIFYFKPLYSVCLSVPILRKLLFKTFGYRGDFSFVVYPDAWIRDLPLLRIGRSVYLANRCTVGTNLCLNDGSILVGECTFADNSMVGHLAIFGLGCYIGTSSEIGVGTSLGIRVKLGDHVVVAPKCVIYHGADIGHHVKIGACSVIGLKAKIAPHLELRIGAVIPPGAVVSTQAEADEYFSSETQTLREQKDNLTELLRKNLHEFETSRR